MRSTHGHFRKTRAEGGRKNSAQDRKQEIKKSSTVQIGRRNSTELQGGLEKHTSPVVQ